MSEERMLWAVMDFKQCRLTSAQYSLIVLARWS